MKKSDLKANVIRLRRVAVARLKEIEALKAEVEKLKKKSTKKKTTTKKAAKKVAKKTTKKKTAKKSKKKDD